MDVIIETAQRWVDKLTKTTDLLLNLGEETELPNGWGKREILIHLTGWDSEFIGFAEEMRKKIKFYQFYEEEGEAKNQQFFQESKELSYADVVAKFKKTRVELQSVYNEIITEYPQDNKEFAGYFSIWWHDAHHLKQAGCDVSHLDE